MTTSLAHPEEFGIRAELLTGLDRLNLGSTCMSNGDWRDRLILRLFLGDDLRGLEKENNRRHGQSLKSVQSLGWIIGNQGQGRKAGSRHALLRALGDFGIGRFTPKPQLGWPAPQRNFPV